MSPEKWDPFQNKNKNNRVCGNIEGVEIQTWHLFSFMSSTFGPKSTLNIRRFQCCTNHFGGLQEKVQRLKKFCILFIPTPTWRAYHLFHPTQPFADFAPLRTPTSDERKTYIHAQRPHRSGRKQRSMRLFKISGQKTQQKTQFSYLGKLYIHVFVAVFQKSSDI